MDPKCSSSVRQRMKLVCCSCDSRVELQRRSPHPNRTQYAGWENRTWMGMWMWPLWSWWSCWVLGNFTRFMWPINVLSLYPNCRQLRACVPISTGPPVPIPIPPPTPPPHSHAKIVGQAMAAVRLFSCRKQIDLLAIKPWHLSH